jgi:hypothetical protein
LKRVDVEAPIEPEENFLTTQVEAELSEPVPIEPEPKVPEPEPEPQLSPAEQSALALLKRGEASERNSEFFEAVRDFQAVRRRWPQTDSAKVARGHIIRLRNNEPLRTWRSKGGGYTVVARYKREEDGRVVLERDDGTTLRIDFAQLSRDDQLYVVMRRTRI